MSEARPRRPKFGSPGGVRLLASPSRVYLGPDARGALEGKWGLLRGAKRPGWVDVLELSTCARSRASEITALRFRKGSGWPVVGLSLPEIDWRPREASLLRELFPGDVVITEKTARVHLGDTWAAAPLLRDGGSR